LTPAAGSNLIQEWFVATAGMTQEQWQEDDKVVLLWMAEHHADLEQKIAAYTKEVVAAEVIQVMTAGGNTSQIGIAGIMEGLSQGLEKLSPEERRCVRQFAAETFKL
jgi:hypothetical protein